MRTIERASAFKRDFKREAKGRYRDVLDAELRQVLALLVLDATLDSRHRDHELAGE